MRILVLVIPTGRGRIFVVGCAASKISVPAIVESLLLVVCRAESRRVRKRGGGSTSWSIIERLTRLGAITGLRVIAKSVLSHVIVCLGTTIYRSRLALGHIWRGTSARRKRSVVIRDDGRMA